MSRYRRLPLQEPVHLTLGDLSSPASHSAAGRVAEGGNARAFPTNAFIALSKIGPAAVPVLIEALEDERGVVREESAWMLGHVGPQAVAAIAALREALKAPDHYVRESSASALDRIGPAGKGDR